MRLRRLWAVDAGNTAIKIAAIEGDMPILVRRFPRRDWEDLFRDIASVIHEMKRIFPSARGIACAAGRENDIEPLRWVAGELQRGVEPVFLTPEGPLPFKLNYTSGSPGADRLANVMALRSLLPGKNAISIDFGTATHTEIVDRDGGFLGGVILPSPQVQADSLVMATEGRLPGITLVPGDEVRVAACSTEGAIMAGVLIGHAGAVERLVADVASDFGHASLNVVLTGGGVSLVAPLLKMNHQFEPFLTLIGLAAYWETVAG